MAEFGIHRAMLAEKDERLRRGLCSGRAAQQGVDQAVPRLRQGNSRDDLVDQADLHCPFGAEHLRRREIPASLARSDRIHDVWADCRRVRPSLTSLKQNVARSVGSRYRSTQSVRHRRRGAPAPHPPSAFSAGRECAAYLPAPWHRRCWPLLPYATMRRIQSNRHRAETATDAPQHDDRISLRWPSSLRASVSSATSSSSNALCRSGRFSVSVATPRKLISTRSASCLPHERKTPKRVSRTRGQERTNNNPTAGVEGCPEGRPTHARRRAPSLWRWRAARSAFRCWIDGRVQIVDS